MNEIYGTERGFTKLENNEYLEQETINIPFDDVNPCYFVFCLNDHA